MFKSILTTIKKLEMRLNVRFNVDFWKSFVSTIGTISAIVTLLSFIFKIEDPCVWIIILYIVIVIGGSIVITLFLTHKKETLRIAISNNLEVCAKSGNIFDYAIGTNYVVIPVNEYFDTVVNTKIVSPNSLHGQFINKYFQCNHSQLHEIIDNYLKSNDIEHIDEVVRPNKGGYSYKYPLGTCVPVKVEQVTYVLVALTHFDNDDHAFVELSEYGRCISSLCKYLQDNAGKNNSYMPLMGMGLSRLNQTGQFILKYTLDTIVGVKDLAIPGGLNIIVFPAIAKTIDLNSIKY